MPSKWKPSAGQVTLIERPGGLECVTGVVIDSDGEPVMVEVGTMQLPYGSSCEVVASFIAADALYCTNATLTLHDGLEAVIDLRIHDVERVQRRTAPRATMAIPILMSNFDDPGAVIDGDFGSVLCESIDVSEGGCRVVAPRRFPSGCDPTVTLRLPSGGAVVALAAVLEEGTLADGRYEYRLVFTEMDDLDRLRLARLVTAASIR